MSSVFVTGSADGLGLMAARLLAEQGHAVTLHAEAAGADGAFDAVIHNVGVGYREPR